MFVNLSSKTQRRGVVLILILGMLGLLALIGVTFAIFSGQARINARNFMQGSSLAGAGELMDFALAQLIDDTANPQSALRGHSLARDMYGYDANFNGFLPLGVASFQQVAVVSANAGSPPPANVMPYPLNLNAPISLYGTYECVTSLSFAAFPNFNFARWIVTFPGQAIGFPPTGYSVGQSYEVVFDDTSGKGASSSNRVFYLAPLAGNSPTPTPALVPPVALGARGPYAPALLQTPGATSQYTISSQLIGELALVLGAAAPVPVNTAFALDGRYLHAFNGPGMGPLGTYGNFRYNGALLASNGVPGQNAVTGNPDGVSMDEDYDACDLDNWFLAIQSADGQVIIPSFHRPAIIRADPTQLGVPNSPASDWWNSPTNPWNALGINPLDSMSRILRPRQADGHDPTAFPDLIPDPSTGKITYDVDNDGDGITDAVWLDLGYPPQRNSDGVLYKPLFAFTVIGLNGRLPLNTAGNLQHRDSGSGPPNQTTSWFAGTPLFAQASRLGISPSEVDITFALQNADDRLNRIAVLAGGAPALNYTQFDNSDPGSSVDQYGQTVTTGTPGVPNNTWKYFDLGNPGALTRFCLP